MASGWPARPLSSAIMSRDCGQAALDMFETEPTPAERWRDVPNVVLAPHVAGLTLNSSSQLIRHTVARLEAVLGLS